MFPGRYGRRNVVNRCSVVTVPCAPLVGVGLLVQILGSGRGCRSVVCRVVRVVVLFVLWCCLWVGVGDKPSAY